MRRLNVACSLQEKTLPITCPLRQEILPGVVSNNGGCQRPGTMRIWCSQLTSLHLSAFSWTPGFHPLRGVFKRLAMLALETPGHQLIRTQSALQSAAHLSICLVVANKPFYWQTSSITSAIECKTFPRQASKPFVLNTEHGINQQFGSETKLLRKCFGMSVVVV
jgi:hypothetical protein